MQYQLSLYLIAYAFIIVSIDPTDAEWSPFSHLIQFLCDFFIFAVLIWVASLENIALKRSVKQPQN